MDLGKRVDVKQVQMLLEIDKLCFDSSILEPRVAIKIMDSQVVFSQLGLSV